MLGHIITDEKCEEWFWEDFKVAEEGVRGMIQGTKIEKHPKLVEVLISLVYLDGAQKVRESELFKRLTAETDEDF